MIPKRSGSASPRYSGSSKAGSYAWSGTAALSVSTDPEAPVTAKEAADAAARLDEAYAAWDAAIGAIDEARRKQMAAPGLQEPAKKALATLDREWDGLAAHRDYPMISLDNYPDAAVMPRSGPGRGVSAGRGGDLAA